MKEKDYMDVSDLNAVIAAKEILMRGHFLEEPNKTRYLSVMANLQLMSANLFDEIKVESDDETTST
jgi:hypothetical protein